MTDTTWTLEPAQDGDLNLYKHDVYERSSVLAGSPRRSLMGFYKTVEEAIEANPDIEIQVIGHSTKVEHIMPDCPPAWFDEANAGETW